MPTIAPGTEARCMARGIAFSRAASRLPEGPGSQEPEGTPAIRVVDKATAHRPRAVASMFISFSTPATRSELMRVYQHGCIATACELLGAPAERVARPGA